MKTGLTMLLSLSLLDCGGSEVMDLQAETANLEEALSTPTILSVGRHLFNDTRLSEPAGQSCASCHDSAHGYADPRPGPCSPGVVAGRFGSRNAPSIAYASYVPSLTAAGNETGYSGGLFWDGRSPDLESQVEGPLLNPLEMNNADRATVVNKVKSGPYASKFKKVFGSAAFDDPDTAFGYIATAIATFERRGIVQRFTSKYDAYLAGKIRLSASEQRGLALFENPAKGNCASCHIDKPGADGSPPLFTDQGYDNLGIPRNPANPFYTQAPEYNPAGASYVDRGLANSILNLRQVGKFRAPSLRNVAVTAPYGHNGYFATLAAIVHFYNTRDVAAAKWDAPEVTFGLNTVDMGNLGLTAQDEEDLVTFMKALTDGYF